MEFTKATQIYTYWGVHFKASSGEELIATCPFCNHDDKRTNQGHLYVNSRSGAFDCKSCGKQGGRCDFLKYIYEEALKDTTTDQLLKLTREKGIPLPILEKRKVACTGTRYLFPVYGPQNEIVDLRIWRRKRKEHGTGGAETGLYGYEDVLDPSRIREPVYLCEGCFDKLALDWLLWRTNKPGIVLSVCGANTFKDNWTIQLQNRNIILCYDNDDAGYGFLDINTGKAAGSRKAEARLRNVAHNIKFLTWPATYKDGYDVRQLIIDNKDDPKECYNTLQSMLFGHHRDDDFRRNQFIHNETQEKIELRQITDEFSKLYELNQTMYDAIKLALATAISVNMPGSDNVWLFLVGPPGSGKTMILNMFEYSLRCKYESSLSVKGLVSGWNLDKPGSIDPSILANVNDKCLVLKDYTEILAKNKAEKEEIFSILRGAYDGKVNRIFGSGSRNYICNFSFIAGVTYEIKAYTTAALGERFLQYQVVDRSIDVEEIQEKALNAQLMGVESVDELKRLVGLFLNNNYDFSGPALLGRIPRWFRDRIKPLSRLAAHLRTPVQREIWGRMQGEIIYEPVPETGNRLATQLEKLAISLSIIEDKPEIDEEIYNLIKRVAVDTIYNYSYRLVRRMIGEQRSFHKKELAQITNISGAHNYIDDLEALRIVERNGQAKYHVTKLIRDLWSRACL